MVIVPPFRKGTRVRMRPHAKTGRAKVSRTGIVTYCGVRLARAAPGHTYYFDGWGLKVRRDGNKHDRWVPSYDWERDTDPKCAFSDAAVALAKAVLDGDVEAARALADEVFELTRPPAG